MKKRNLLFALGMAVLLMAVTCFAFAEEEEKEKEVDCVIMEWGGGMLLTQPDGSYFTPPPLSFQRTAIQGVREPFE